MSGLRVSDHALLRFLERAGGIPVEELRAQLEAALGRANEAVTAIGGGDYLVSIDAHTFVVRANAAGAIVTTMIDKIAPSRRRYRALDAEPPE